MGKSLTESLQTEGSTKSYEGSLSITNILNYGESWSIDIRFTEDRSRMLGFNLLL